MFRTVPEDNIWSTLLLRVSTGRLYRLFACTGLHISVLALKFSILFRFFQGRCCEHTGLLQIRVYMFTSKTKTYIHFEFFSQSSRVGYSNYDLLPTRLQSRMVE